MTEPAEELRAAEERVRMGDRRIDIALRGPIADWLRTAIEDAETIGTDPHALAVARAVNGQQPRETGCAGTGGPQEATAGPNQVNPEIGAQRGADGFKPIEPCAQKAGVLPHPPHKFMRGARLYQCPGNVTPDTIEIINPRNTGWYWHCTTCGAEAGKFTAESSARDAARTEHPQCPPGPDGPYAWTIPADHQEQPAPPTDADRLWTLETALRRVREAAAVDQPDPDLNSLRQEIYTRLNREAEFVGCPSATTDDIVRLVRAWHEPSCDSHEPSVDSTDAAPGGNAEDCEQCAGTNPPYPWLCPGHDTHHFGGTDKVIKDDEPAPDGLRAQYAEAILGSDVIPSLRPSAARDMATAVLAVRDREMQQLRRDAAGDRGTDPARGSGSKEQS